MEKPRTHEQPTTLSRWTSFTDALRVTNDRAGQTEIDRSATTFIERVVQSQRFTWFAAVEHQDELHRPRMSVYLLEDVNGRRDEESIDPNSRERRDVLPAFAKLSRSIRDYWLTNLYILDNTKVSSADLQAVVAHPPQNAPADLRVVCSRAATSEPVDAI